MGYLTFLMSPWKLGSLSDRTPLIQVPPWWKTLIHTPMFPLIVMLCLSWCHSHIYIVTFCCYGLHCWVILTERLVNWGSRTANYVCSLLLWLIKWISAPFLELGQDRRYVPPLRFSHSSMMYMVYGRLGYLLLPTLFVVCLWSIVRQKVLTGPIYIPWLWLIYPFYVI